MGGGWSVHCRERPRIGIKFNLTVWNGLWWGGLSWVWNGALSWVRNGMEEETPNFTEQNGVGCGR